MADNPTYAEFTRSAQEQPPAVALILGSGLSDVARRLERALSVPFLEVPGLETTSVVGHKGCLTLGDWAGQRVLVFQGRLHYYEGHPWRRVVAPVHIAQELGARIVLVTNAAGGIHDALVPGSLMPLTDHIDWNRPCCWRDPGPGGLGGPRPSPYAPRLLHGLLHAGQQVGLALHAGIYAQVTGPCYETPAEIRALKTWGADAVGMSTGREVQAAHELGMACAGLSMITNRAAGLSAGPLHHEEVLTTAAAQKEHFGDLVEAFLQSLTV